MRATLSGLSAILCAGMLLTSGPILHAQAPQVSDLILTFEYDGQAPPPAAINNLVAGCNGPLFKPELRIGKNGGVRDVVVQLFLAQGVQAPAPVLAAPAAPAPFLNNKRCEFDPHVLHVRCGAKLTIGNADQIAHTANVLTAANPPGGGLIPAAGNLNLAFAKPERLPARVTCGIHPWMSALLVVTDHPFVGISDENGKVVIQNLPPGNYTFRAWHETCGYIQTPKQNGVALAWPLGKFPAILAAGVNNLGTFKFK